ncbi:MAG TPA: endonuclease domain-containing protein [Thermoanaerobaculia bacterium]
MKRTTLTREQARGLRKEQTPAEQALWEILRDRQILGLKFRRQSPVNRYIADFCCRELRLIVEVDGDIHSTETQTARDANRDSYLRSQGYTVLRISNDRILANPAPVLEEIARLARHLRSNLAACRSPPLPVTGEGAGG